MSVEVGKPFPNTTFNYVSYVPESESLTSCGRPGPLDTAKEWSDKTVVLVGVPGAFTPTCQANHIPAFLAKMGDLKAKADVVAIVSANDPFVMSAWGKANGIKDEILMLCDPNLKWGKQTGYDLDLSSFGIGQRLTRFGMIIKNGTVVYAEKEPNPSAQPTVSSAENLLSKL
ncbi:putative Allergen [Taphrina deformans PYCC 5710]|uniref:Thioredoxin peroxidase n=1 Tax=Taphrina deformans (strain PYCC 5710 / ATCC 11124 / CBS 356.35 / IMI 108563 / JCM 9778 / NBRC 8474) TaxID=1097556 RepID=R4XAU6_TAPDE|nr:putative Allergen [Taphrina deformans PYCC 5710]|eukprot:CCG82984.1 putative Allergen [Taphrina deformans PYCC 5710]